MTREEHGELVSVVRGMHEKLRVAYWKADGDYEKIWKDHLLDVELREQYSCSMMKLATKVWSKYNTRIEWCYKICMDYFRHGGLARAKKKAKRSCVTNTIMTELHLMDTVFKDPNSKIKLLDVGSCYNPFSKFDDFICFPIDLTPATEDVYQCDFLQLKIIPWEGKMNDCVEFWNPLSELSENMFHVVVFSLVLEYLPAPEQRWIFCQKAFKLLKCDGLLIIITPDSKSQYHNSPMIKSWKTGLASIGFERLYYEKQTHIHCMAFRKTLQNKYSNEISLDLAKLLYIPQDFKKYSETIAIINRTESENEDICLSFNELPMSGEE